MQQKISASFKFVAVMLHILRGYLTVVLLFPRLSVNQKQQRIHHWALDLLAKLAIKLVVRGKSPTQGPVVLAANHISWLDIILLQATCTCRFVAKSEVRQWPVIGTLATAANTLFIERASPRDAVRVVHQMVTQLRAGEVLAIFPEGTTSNGVNLLAFHANLFQAPITANVPVQPVALQFLVRSSGQRSLAPCYIGDDSLLGSIWRTLNAPHLGALVTFGDPQLPLGRQRRDWATDMRTNVAALFENQHPRVADN
jgi:1-acyl-sn-glycerol-3-phosphate acyltransferase